MRNLVTLATAARLVGATTIALALTTGCVPLEEQTSIQQALPTADSVRIDVPAQYKALGDTAEFYRLTRQLSEDLNGGAGWVLVLVHTVVQYPPTKVEGNVYTWGPHSDALDPAEWRLTVIENDDATYDWSLDARSKIAEGAEFLTIIDGNATPGAEEHHGHGSFRIDFDAAESVDPDGNDAQGKLAVEYNLGDKAGQPIAISMHAEVADPSGTPGEIASFDYKYDEQPDGSGALQFGLHGDVDNNGSLEDMRVHSRWQANGAGRADVTGTSGSLGEIQIQASECWDTRFARVYYTDSANWQAPEGTQEACTFAEAAYPTL